MFDYIGKRRLLYFMGLIVLLISIAVCYGLMTILTARGEQEKNSETAINGYDTTHLAYKTGVGSIIVFERQYTKCGDTLSEQTEMTSSHTGKTREDMQLAFPTWKLVEFKPEKIVFRKEIDGYCPMHYIIKEKDDFLAIFRSAKETGDLYIENELPIRFDWLDAETQNQIRDALVLDTVEEVEKLAESWVS